MKRAHLSFWERMDRAPNLDLCVVFRGVACLIKLARAVFTRLFWRVNAAAVAFINHVDCSVARRVWLHTRR